MNNFAQKSTPRQAKDTFDMSGLPNGSNYLDWDYDTKAKEKPVAKKAIKSEGFENTNDGILRAVKRLLEEAPNDFKARIYLKGSAAVENAKVDHDDDGKAFYVLPVLRGKDESAAEKRMKAIVPILSSLFGKYVTVKESEGVRGIMDTHIYDGVLEPALTIQLINGDLSILVFADAVDFL